MFVDNRLGGPVRLARALLQDDIPVASMNVLGRYALRDGRLEFASWANDGPLASILGDPLWQGTGVSVLASVPGPSRAPHQAEVRLSVASSTERRELRLVVSGERIWIRRGSELVATEPTAFESMPLTVDRAYGGSVEVPPGPMPETDLPQPGGTVAFPQNPTGKGFCIAEGDAERAPLPNVEWHDAQVRAWSDRADPGIVVPCPDLPVLRLDMEAMSSDTWRANFRRQALRALHVGHGRCIFGELLPGASIALGGTTLPTTRFVVPAPPIAVGVRRRGVAHTIRPRLRAVVLDVERGVVDLAWGAGLTWPAHTQGGEMRVERAA